ncbi:MAG: hypothetical protein QGH26_03435 [Candidatus Pacebacteria bacterium]|jgi:hypothetical protein|nr:hypothetical protein [Candidatus Paceibacterota bacterium]|tara:strand:- start:436 stop:888 length:453 start_codon:yes stop_codon:yes gene_type:complete
MAKQGRTTLKGYFETGDQPTEDQFADTIDSFLNLSATGTEQMDGVLEVSGSSAAVNIAGPTAGTLVDVDSATVSHIVHISGNGAIQLSGSLQVSGSYNGDVSSSADSTGSFGLIEAGGSGSAAGIVLQSPDGSRFKLTVNNAGSSSLAAM